MKTAYTLAIALLIATLACQTKPKQEAATDTTAATPDSAAALAKRPGRDAPRSAADRLVRALYFEHSKTENPLRDTKDRTLVEQYFHKDVADKIVGQTSQAKGNPLYGVPDTDVKKMWVEPAAVGGSRAIVYVTFENKGKPEEIKVDLREIGNNRWRITNMTYPDGKKLSELF